MERKLSIRFTKFLVNNCNILGNIVLILKNFTNLEHNVFVNVLDRKVNFTNEYEKLKKIYENLKRFMKNSENLDETEKMNEAIANEQKDLLKTEIPQVESDSEKNEEKGSDDLKRKISEDNKINSLFQMVSDIKKEDNAFKVMEENLNLLYEDEYDDTLDNTNRGTRGRKNSGNMEADVEFEDNHKFDKDYEVDPSYRPQRKKPSKRGMRNFRKKNSYNRDDRIVRNDPLDNYNVGEEDMERMEKD